ncbi:MAG: SPOR domain-containing protein [Spirochaetota bacterium]
MGERKNKKLLRSFPGATSNRVFLLLLILLSSVPSVLSAQEDSPASESSDLDELLLAGDPEFLEGLDRLISTTSSVSAVHQILNDYLENPDAGDFVGEISRRKAELYELQGEYEFGRDTLAALGETILFSGPDPLAVDLARLEFELGELGAAEERLGRLTGRQVTRKALREISLLRCRISLAQKHQSSFDSCIATLEREGWRDISLALSLQWARETGDAGEVERVSAALEEEFPLVWESLSAGDGRVSGYPSPARIFSGSEAMPETGPESAVVESPAPAPDPAPDPKPAGVQVGSFRDRENAEYMARDVGELGFSVSIRSREHDGGTYYQVLVAPGEATPQNTVVRLKEHGLEGFLIFD